MKRENATSILAAFATLKTLNDENNYSSPYQLLAEFINYIICEKKIYSFTTIEMKNQLSEAFGFEIPEAVVKTASKAMDYISRKDNVFTVDKEKLIANNKFYESIKLAKNDNNCIIKRISAYITEKYQDKELIENDLSSDLIAFLIDEHYKSSGKYTDIISEFVLKYEGDEFVQHGLNAIREGSLLYIGINHNINETGSLTKPLTLYLDVEVLFSLVGFNGEVYKTLTYDLYNQVCIANKSKTENSRIMLKYFDDTKKEIDKFFGTAESIVEGKIKLSNKPAMKAIVTGCNTASDVRIKKSDFFSKLSHEYKIMPDGETNYYKEELKKYNLESMDYLDESDQEAWRFVSHINKLRKGKSHNNNLESEYLFVTNTYNILKVSKKQSLEVKENEKMDSICDFAITVDKMTNILWYKLGSNFGCREFPNNINTVLKARLVLASNIATNVERIYKETMEQYRMGEITDEQLAARIITLREKPVFPEELEGDHIDDNMDFSAEYLSRYEEEVKSNKNALQEKEKIIREIEAQKQLEIDEKEKTIKKKEQQLQEREKENKFLESELNFYRDKEERQRKKRIKIKNILSFLLSIVWKGAIVSLIIVLGNWLEKKTKIDFKYLFFAIDWLSVIIAIYSEVKRCKAKYLNRNEE